MQNLSIKAAKSPQYIKIFFFSLINYHDLHYTVLCSHIRQSFICYFTTNLLMFINCKIKYISLELTYILDCYM